MADNAPMSKSGQTKTVLSTIVWLAVFVLAGFFLRAYFGADVGFDAESGRQVFTGNDPYYHWRTVSHVLETGSNLNIDPDLHYPEGRANPNPPFWTWTVAPVAAMFQSMGVGDGDPVGAALNVMVALWGALVAVPVYLLGRDLWGRAGGLWAAFFATISAPMIDRSVWGYADHDALVLFFTLLGTWFLVRAFRSATAAKDGAPLGATLKANQTAMIWAALAGVAITAIAVTWKGYPYLLGVLALSLFLNAVIQRLRKADALVGVAIHLVALAVATFLPWLLYYQAFPYFVGKTVLVGVYVLAGSVLAAVLLVPTRKVPPVVLFPAVAVLGVASVFALRVLAPDVYGYITSGLGYFVQSKLYSTIGEAQRPALGSVAAQLGFFTFLLAFWGLARNARLSLKGDGAHIVVLSLALVSLYLMFSAARFVANGAPIFAILLGYPVMQLVRRMKIDEMGRKFQSLHGKNVATRAAKSLTVPVAAWATLIGLLVILPNVWLGADAAMPREYEAKHIPGLTDYGFGNIDETLTRSAGGYVYKETPRFGALGIGFELESNGWLPALEVLSNQDTGLAFQDRPAAIAWWDYGHWIVSLGQHPTVADPFQSHHDFSAQFLTAKSEAQGLNLLSILLLDDDADQHGGHYGPEVQALVAEHGYLANLQPRSGYQNQLKVLDGNATTAEKASALYEDVMAATGKGVGYFAVNDLMFPADNPNTSGVDRPSIFYAPVYLADKNPDDYMAYSLTSGQTTLKEQRYTVDNVTGQSKALDRPVYTDAQGTVWVNHRGYLYRPGQTPNEGYAATSGIPVTDSIRTMQVTSTFYETMYAKAFGGLGANQAPGAGLAHWRAITQTVGGGGREVVILAYTQGVQASGKLTGPDGNALAGYRVTFSDAFGAPHAEATTDASGNWNVRAPFAVEGDLALRILSPQGGLVFTDNSTRVQFTREQSDAGAAVSGLDVKLETGSLSGRVFRDQKGAENSTTPDGQYQAGEEVSDVTVQVAGQTLSVAADGTFSASGLLPSTYTATVTGSAYANKTATFTVPSGDAAAPQNVSVTYKQSTLSLTYLNGTTPMGDVPIAITGPTSTSVTTNATGIATTSLLPGEYTLKVNATVPAGATVRQVAEQKLTVPTGGAPLAVTVTRQA